MVCQINPPSKCDDLVYSSQFCLTKSIAYCKFPRGTGPAAPKPKTPVEAPVPVEAAPAPPVVNTPAADTPPATGAPILNARTETHFSGDMLSVNGQIEVDPDLIISPDN